MYIYIYVCVCVCVCLCVFHLHTNKNIYTNLKKQFSDLSSEKIFRRS